jgi:hemin uptake protein HemP
LHHLANHALFVLHHSKKFTMRHSMVGKLLLDSNVTYVGI